MKKQSIFLLTILLGFVLISCEKDDNDTNISIFPFLKTGNTWTYKMTIDGKDAPSNVIYNIQSIDNDGYCVIKFTAGNNSHTDYRWYANSDFFADESGSETDYWFPLFYKNNTIGKKWSSPIEDEDLGTIKREIVSTTENISVPAGTFSNCIKIKETFTKDSKIINYYYVSSQAGIIKKESTGWADIDNNPRIYFPVIVELKSKNF